jgi:hypothetical protein
VLRLVLEGMGLRFSLFALTSTIPVPPSDTINSFLSFVV